MYEYDAGGIFNYPQNYYMHPSRRTTGHVQHLDSEALQEFSIFAQA